MLFRSLIAVQVTSWCKRWLPKRLWHGIHLLSIPMFVVGTVHGFQSGADGSNALVQWGALTGSVSLLFLLLFRTTSGSGRRRSVVGRGSVGADERVAALRAARGAADGGDALGDQRPQGAVQPVVRQVERQLGHR